MVIEIPSKLEEKIMRNKVRINRPDTKTYPSVHHTLNTPIKNINTESYNGFNVLTNDIKKNNSKWS
jgi:hypothetical protein